MAKSINPVNPRTRSVGADGTGRIGKARELAREVARSAKIVGSQKAERQDLIVQCLLLSLAAQDPRVDNTEVFATVSFVGKDGELIEKDVYLSETIHTFDTENGGVKAARAAVVRYVMECSSADVGKIDLGQNARCLYTMHGLRTSGRDIGQFAGEPFNGKFESELYSQWIEDVLDNDGNLTSRKATKKEFVAAQWLKDILWPIYQAYNGKVGTRAAEAMVNLGIAPQEGDARLTKDEFKAIEAEIKLLSAGSDDNPTETSASTESEGGSDGESEGGNRATSKAELHPLDAAAKWIQDYSDNDEATAEDHARFRAHVTMVMAANSKSTGHGPALAEVKAN